MSPLTEGRFLERGYPDIHSDMVTCDEQPTIYIQHLDQKLEVLGAVVVKVNYL